MVARFTNDSVMVTITDSSGTTGRDLAHEGALTVLEQQAGAKQLSARDSARGTIGKAEITVDYGRPLARGRVLLGNVIEYDRIWRTGANAATQFSTSAPITLTGLDLPAAACTLWTAPHEHRIELIVNKQFGQWGTSYDLAQDLGSATIVSERVTPPVEELTIKVLSADATHGTLVIEWGNFRWTAPIVVR